MIVLLQVRPSQQTCDLAMIAFGRTLRVSPAFNPFHIHDAVANAATFRGTVAIGQVNQAVLRLNDGRIVERFALGITWFDHSFMLPTPSFVS